MQQPSVQQAAVQRPSAQAIAHQLSTSEHPAQTAHAMPQQSNTVERRLGLTATDLSTKTELLAVKVTDRSTKAELAVQAMTRQLLLSRQTAMVGAPVKATTQEASKQQPHAR